MNKKILFVLWSMVSGVFAAEIVDTKVENDCGALESLISEIEMKNIIGMPEMIRLLKSSEDSTDKNAEGDTALHIACKIYEILSEKIYRSHVCTDEEIEISLTAENEKLNNDRAREARKILKIIKCLLLKDYSLTALTDAQGQFPLSYLSDNSLKKLIYSLEKMGPVNINAEHISKRGNNRKEISLVLLQQNINNNFEIPATVNLHINKNVVVAFEIFRQLFYTEPFEKAIFEKYEVTAPADMQNKLKNNEVTSLELFNFLKGIVIDLINKSQYKDIENVKMKAGFKLLPTFFSPHQIINIIENKRLANAKNPEDLKSFIKLVNKNYKLPKSCTRLSKLEK